MLIIIKDGMLTEDKKESCYRYSGLFKVINRLCKLIETMEEVGEYITYYDKEFAIVPETFGLSNSALRSYETLTIEVFGKWSIHNPLLL